MEKFLRDRLQLNGFALSEDQVKRVVTYIRMIAHWNTRINLTGHRSARRLIDKDILDCMYIIMYIILYRIMYRIMYTITYRIMYRIVNEDLRASLIDVGAGAGYLGVLTKILAPAVHVGFVESNRRKINFLRSVCRQLKFKGVSFHNQRIEDSISTETRRYNVAVTRATFNSQDIIENVHNYVQNSVHNDGHIICMVAYGKNIHFPPGRASDALQTCPKYNYTIKPENLHRTALILKKISQPVSRERR